MAKQWIAFFSQTGSEIVALSKAIGRKPDLIVTNNIEQTKYAWHPGLSELGTKLIAKHDRLMSYFTDTSVYDPENTIITLHGYLRILPPSVCTKFSIYNGHPGAIELYPELKGMDPQVRAWENKDSYKFIGSVVHKVTPGVDEGEIIKTVNVINNVYSLDEMYNQLKFTSQAAWVFAMKEIGL